VAYEELDENGRANVELRLKLLMAHAKVGGWIVEKKQTTKATLDVSKLLNGSEEPIPAHGAVRVLMRDGLWAISEEERDRLLPGWRERERPVEMPIAGPTEPHSRSKRPGRPLVVAWLVKQERVGPPRAEEPEE
jgi:hypothetical protein